MGLSRPSFWNLVDKALLFLVGTALLSLLPSSALGSGSRSWLSSSLVKLLPTRLVPSLLTVAIAMVDSANKRRWMVYTGGFKVLDEWLHMVLDMGAAVQSNPETLLAWVLTRRWAGVLSVSR